MAEECKIAVYILRLNLHPVNDSSVSIHNLSQRGDSPFVYRDGTGWPTSRLHTIVQTELLSLHAYSLQMLLDRTLQSLQSFTCSHKFCGVCKVCRVDRVRGVYWSLLSLQSLLLSLQSLQSLQT